MNLTPDRIEEMILTAEHRAGRTRALRRAATVAVSLTAVAAVGLGVWALAQGDYARPVVASPGPAAPSWPTAPSGEFVDFGAAYTMEEQQLVLQTVALALDGKDPAQFWAVVTKTTWEDGLMVHSPDARFEEIDDRPALNLRIGGPLSDFAAPSVPWSTESPEQLVAEVARISTIGLDGRSLGTSVLFQTRGGETPKLPAVDPALERDAALVPLLPENLHLPPEQTLPAEDLALVHELQATFSRLLPDRLTLAESPEPVGDVWSSFTFTLSDGVTSTGGSLNLWHLASPASLCDDGEVCQDDTGAWQRWRPDQTAIYLMGLQDVLTEDEAQALLLDPAWDRFLDLMKQEPAQ